jgi:hypothetical protein
MKHRIVMNHNYAIARGMDVELDAIRAKLERALEGRYRVFGQLFVRAAVGDSERWRAFWWQVSLRECGLGRPNL